MAQEEDDKETFVALYDFQAGGENQLSLKKGNLYFLLNIIINTILHRYQFVNIVHLTYLFFNISKQVNKYVSLVTTRVENGARLSRAPIKGDGYHRIM